MVWLYQSWVRFQGVHPDAVVGVDVKVAGAQRMNRNTNRLYQTLQKAGALEPQRDKSFRTSQFTPLTLRPEASGEIALEFPEGGKSYRIGWLPKAVGQSIQSWLQQGHRLHAALTRIKPYKKGTEWHHALETRLELLTPPDRAPDAPIARTAQDTFQRVYRITNGAHLMTVIPESVSTHSVGNGVLTERWDQERRELTYYWNDALVSRVPIPKAPGVTVKPVFRQPLPTEVETKISELANLER